MIPALYKISQEQLRINEALMENGGELTPELEEALIINENNFAVKVENYIASIHHFDALVEAADAEIKRITAIKKAAFNASRGLKDNLTNGMAVMGLEKADIGLNKLSFRHSTAVTVTDESKIPPCYIKVETKVDKESLKRDLKAGLVIEGAALTTNKTLQIR